MDACSSLTASLSKLGHPFHNLGRVPGFGERLTVELFCRTRRHTLLPLTGEQPTRVELFCLGTLLQVRHGLTQWKTSSKTIGGPSIGIHSDAP